MTPAEVRDDHIKMLRQEVACTKGGASLSHEVYAEALDRCQRKNKIDWYADIDALLEERDSLVQALQSIAANSCCDGCQEAARVAQAALTRSTDRRE